MASDNTGRAKRWCFTINNFIPDEVLSLRRLGRMGAECTYLVFGRETSESGTRHLQGYCEFKLRRRLRQAKALLGDRAHLEISRGTPEQASAYCQKDLDFESFGTLAIGKSTQGTRSDLDEIRDLIHDGIEEEKLAEEHFSTWVIHRRAFREYRSLRSMPRNSPTEVYVFWGDTGTGKTQKVYGLEEDLWVAPDNQLNWFDGYSGQEAALFDDFVGCKNAKYGLLLRLLDRYPMQVPVKGGFTNWRPARVYITSNLPPEGWFFGVSELQRAALRRRLDSVEHFVTVRSGL